MFNSYAVKSGEEPIRVELTKSEIEERELQKSEFLQIKREHYLEETQRIIEWERIVDSFLETQSLTTEQKAVFKSKLLQL